MKTIAVTGGSGGAGHYVIKELLEHGYECVNIDSSPPKEELCPFKQLNMQDYEAVYNSISGTDALVHFAANPHPDEDHWEAADRFANNTVILYNAFNAAQAHGIKRVVWASSETVFGYPFKQNLPSEIPLKDDTPLQPQNGYALSKAVSEELARLMHMLYGMDFIGLRLSNVLYDDESVEPSFQKIPGYWKDFNHRKFNLWGYVAATDVAAAVRKSLEIEFSGADNFYIGAPDTIMKQETRHIAKEVFPEVNVLPEVKGRDPLISSEKARVVLGYEPKTTWSKVLGIEA